MDIFVIRINANNDLVNSRPCYNCLSMMKAVKIHRVFYSINGNIECERITEMISINASSVTRFLEAQAYNAPIEKEQYYKALFIKYLPKEIAFTNFNKFIKYNFTEVLPNYSWKIVINKITFYDGKNNYVKSCQILF